MLENAYSRPLPSAGDFTRKVGQTDLVLACDQGSLVGLCTKDYKSLCEAVTIRSTLVNIQTHLGTHMRTDNILTSLYEKLGHLS